MDARAGSGRARVDHEADDRPRRIDRGVLSSKATTRRAEDVEPALDSFSTRALALDLRAAYGSVPKRPGVCYFFPRPSAGSGCKRLNLFLRWMVRRDALDLGVWTRVSPAKLVVPLDTHVIRVGRCLRLTRYTSPGWPMARDITASLRRLDPDDPVKYDFALCHLGMMNACGFDRTAVAPALGMRNARFVASAGPVEEVRTQKRVIGTPSLQSGQSAAVVVFRGLVIDQRDVRHAERPSIAFSRS